MSSVHAITHAARTAQSGLHRALEQVDDVAHTVASGIKSNSRGGDDTFAEQFAALSRMSDISFGARANMHVLNTIDDLDTELLWQRRR